MNRYFNLLLGTYWAVSSSLSPAWADASSSGASSPSSPKTKQNSSSPLLSAPRAVAGICAGFVVGLPICYARKLPEEAKNGAQGLAGSFLENGEAKNKLLLVTAGAFWLPCSAMVTLIEAPVYSFRNAWQAEPFSKEQFSLGELDPPKKK